MRNAAVPKLDLEEITATVPPLPAEVSSGIEQSAARRTFLIDPAIRARLASPVMPKPTKMLQAGSRKVGSSGRHCFIRLLPACLPLLVFSAMASIYGVVWPALPYPLL